MKFRSITVKLLLLVTLVFVVTGASILMVADSQLTRIVDNSQNAMYAEKVAVMEEALARTEARLQKTDLVEAYVDDFKDSVIKGFRETYYNRENQRIFPYVLDSEGRVIMDPLLKKGNTSLLAQLFAIDSQDAL